MKINKRRIKMEDQNVVLNGKKLTLEEFNQKQKEISSQKGVRLVEVSQNVYVTRLYS
jgi:hypothetical protein